MPINVRIQSKRDSNGNFMANNPVLLNGELAVVDTDAGSTRFKVGDGVTAYADLAFQDEALFETARTEILNTIYPIGSVYIGVTDTPPMSCLGLENGNR